VDRTQLPSVLLARFGASFGRSRGSFRASRGSSGVNRPSSRRSRALFRCDGGPFHRSSALLRRSSAWSRAIGASLALNSTTLRSDGALESRSRASFESNGGPIARNDRPLRRSVPTFGRNRASTSRRTAVLAVMTASVAIKEAVVPVAARLEAGRFPGPDAGTTGFPCRTKRLAEDAAGVTDRARVVGGEAPVPPLRASARKRRPDESAPIQLVRDDGDDVLCVKPGRTCAARPCPAPPPALHDRPWQSGGVLPPGFCHHESGRREAGENPARPPPR
jgi:hypothetical protein